MVSAHVPDVASNKQNALDPPWYGTRLAVQPMWQGVSLVVDEFTRCSARRNHRPCDLAGQLRDHAQGPVE